MKTIAEARERANKHLDNQMWLAAWIGFKTDLQPQESIYFSMGDTLTKFFLDAAFGVPVGSDEALVFKAYCTHHVRAMIESVASRLEKDF